MNRIEKLEKSLAEHKRSSAISIDIMECELNKLKIIKETKAPDTYEEIIKELYKDKNHYTINSEGGINDYDSAYLESNGNEYPTHEAAESSKQRCRLKNIALALNGKSGIYDHLVYYFYASNSFTKFKGNFCHIDNCTISHIQFNTEEAREKAIPLMKDENGTGEENIIKALNKLKLMDLMP